MHEPHCKYCKQSLSGDEEGIVEGSLGLFCSDECYDKFRRLVS